MGQDLIYALNENRLRLLDYAIANDNKQTKNILIVGADPRMLAQHNGRAFLFAITFNNVEKLVVRSISLFSESRIS